MVAGGSLSSGSDPLPRLRFLIDTNVFIAVEPYSGATEPKLIPAARLVRLVAENSHRLFVHPATVDDLAEGKDATRLAQQIAEFGKYSTLEESPITEALIAKAGASPEGSNNHRDLRLLAALHAHAANYLITEDLGLTKRARRAGLADAVLSIAEAVALLESLLPREFEPPPQVERIAAYTLNPDQPIFTSLRSSYDGFDEWLAKVQADSDNRTCLIIPHGDDYAALGLLKDETDCDYDFNQPVLKITTFKVGEDYSGAKYGELLLKAIFKIARHNRVATTYVEVFDQHSLLINLFEDFGFAQTEHRTSRGEFVLAKSFIPADAERLSDLEYHRRFGPPALRASRAFLVPIEPKWHEQLFPDSPLSKVYTAVQPTLPGMSQRPHPWGNALRKAYLTMSRIRKLRPGDALLFYRSRDTSAVDAVGVVEDTLRSQDPAEILTFVGRRTVYTPSDIATMCRSAPPLAILFRQDRFIDPAWQVGELNERKVVRGWPQSLTEVSHEEGLKWVRSQLAE
ncbi:GNAT family N-acetyltransferase [Micromonospora arborensis]|uniref:GNAT family N-acetyltransferase n=1 Tax=Micromonospora arborensis TaxID=2116518 RepID=UPI00340925AF